MNENYKAWREEFDILSRDQQIELLNRYYDLHSSLRDDKIYPFNDFGIEMTIGSMISPLEAILMACRNQINADDDYIRLSRDGNLESLSDFAVDDEIAQYAKCIYEEAKWDDIISPELLEDD
jgi:hypothetical protein